MALTKGTNSYATEAEATAYLGDLLGSDAWTTASVPDREKALITATRLVDRALPYRGRVTDLSQALQFPREGDTAVPVDVLRAVYHQALFELQVTAYDRDRRRQNVLGQVGRGLGSANEYSALALVQSAQTGSVLCPEAREFLRPYFGTVEIC